MLRPAAHWSAPGVDCGDPGQQALAPGQGLAGRVWSGDAPLWTAELDEAVTAQRVPVLAAAGIRAAYGVPIRGDETVLGVLLLFPDSGQPPAEDVATLLAAMAAHVGAFLSHRYARGLELELDRSRDDFIALAGHAMRTPLTSIGSYTELLLAAERDWSEPDREMLTVIARHTDKLREIIDDLMELAAIESGHLPPQRRPVDLASLLRAAVAGQAEAAAANAVTVRAELPPTAIIEADPGRLEQLLDNLLSNAVKYSPDGGTVRVGLTADGDNSVTLTVADQGVGVPVGERDQVFRRFFRSSAAIERGIDGTGLGLTIARAIVRAHGGTIGLTSGRNGGSGTGTVVTVRLPVQLR